MSTTDPETARTSRGHRVLVVEDNEAAGKGLAKILQAYGYEVTTAHDGAAALRALASTGPPDFILTDLQLPDMDGRELADHTRHLVPRPRLVLITGWDVDSEPVDPSAWGFEAVMVKPLDIQALLLHLREPVRGGADEPAPVDGGT
jgi:DNA-binding response OmpR family regulator